jgi:hypothetical protein
MLRSLSASVRLLQTRLLLLQADVTPQRMHRDAGGEQRPPAPQPPSLEPFCPAIVGHEAVPSLAHHLSTWED